MSNKQPPPTRFNLLAPSIQRSSAAVSTGPSTRTLGQRDDLGLQRYVLTKPDDILALPNGKQPPGMLIVINQVQ
jgi:hypothetical protein